jgi:hypothetical protein
MRRQMSGAQWRRWVAYIELAGLPSRRAETYLAQIAATIVNIQIAKATKKGRKPDYIDMRKFLIAFGDTPEFLGDAPTRNQSPAEQMAILKAALGVSTTPRKKT